MKEYVVVFWLDDGTEKVMEEMADNRDMAVYLGTCHIIMNEPPEAPNFIKNVEPFERTHK